MPDAETRADIFLFKNVCILRLTYQIKLLTYLAFQKKKKLIIRVPVHFKPHQSLREFINDHQKLIRVEKSR